jgi:mRNA interferase HigB
MDLYGRKILEDLKKTHADTRGPISAWEAEIKDASWKTYQEVKERYPFVDHIGNGLHVFNIKGNKYRVAAKIFVGEADQLVIVKAAGTHKDYDSWDLEERKK